jgi:hypothetical protein
MKVVILIAMLVLAGCSTVPEKEIVRVEVKVRIPCINKAPIRPTYKTGKGDYPGEKMAALILADDLEKAEQYGTNWEAAAAGCIKHPAAKP